MALLLLLLMILIPFLMGRGVLCIFHRDKGSTWAGRTDMLLIGALIGIGVAEGAHMVAVLLNRSLSEGALFFKLGIAVCVLISIVALLRNGKKQTAGTGKMRLERAYTRAEQLIFLAFGVVVILQLIGIMTGDNVYTDGDMTVETVNSFLGTDGIYRVNPMTGQAYEAGIPHRLRIIGLPSLYAFLSQGFRLAPQQVVWHLVPAVVLLYSYMAYFTLACILFPGEPFKRGIFLLFVAVLLCAGDYLYGMEGFNLLHSGFRGASIGAGVLMPYTVSAMLRRRWGLAILCILAEACITWTLYGMGICLAVAVGMALVQLCYRKLRKSRKREGAEEVCRNS